MYYAVKISPQPPIPPPPPPLHSVLFFYTSKKLTRDHNSGKNDVTQVTAEGTWIKTLNTIIFSVEGLKYRIE